MSPFGVFTGLGVCGFFLFAGVALLAYVASETSPSNPVLTSEIVFGDPVMTTTFKKQDRLPQTCP